MKDNSYKDKVKLKDIPAIFFAEVMADIEQLLKA
jgi:hypothetical protein